MLSKRPDVWARLREEVDKLDGETPTYEQVKEFRYLRAVLNESLRLHPIVPTNSREAVVDTTLPVGGGPDGTSPIFIRKGQTVTWSLYVMQRRKDYYGEDADEFKPERWLGEKGLRPGWEYLPFNGGVSKAEGTISSRKHMLIVVSFLAAHLHWAAVCFDRGIIHDHPLDAAVQRHREQRSISMAGGAGYHLRGVQWV